jgi:hypothetical protein
MLPSVVTVLMRTPPHFAGTFPGTELYEYHRHIPFYNIIPTIYLNVNIPGGMRSWTPPNYPEVVFIFLLPAGLPSAECSELAQAKKGNALLAWLGLSSTGCEISKVTLSRDCQEVEF